MLKVKVEEMGQTLKANTTYLKRQKSMVQSVVVMYINLFKHTVAARVQTINCDVKHHLQQLHLY